MAPLANFFFLLQVLYGFRPAIGGFQRLLTTLFCCPPEYEQRNRSLELERDKVLLEVEQLQSCLSLAKSDADKRFEELLLRKRIFMFVLLI
ncbi:hypothetical protein L484_001818 [Morus notabilis]|uniref:Uncharacterized protein n=1 Tax=Morus notabilis TaxID=981085 RepID=W9R4S4_9ROSA|nr:hypothetical protein L484_001818 [Morus notabilis]